MQTVFDWLAIAVFAGLTVIFLQRSAGETSTADKIWHYAPPAIGCATSNYIGNTGLEDNNQLMEIFSIAILALSIFYIFQIIKPFTHKN